MGIDTILILNGTHYSQRWNKSGVFFVCVSHILYGVGHMVKDHSDSERGNPLPQGFFYMHHPTDRITHTTAFVTPVVEHWLE